jgi:SPX domain protein involved in polyphosphate accumulation
LKKKINEIVQAHGGNKVAHPTTPNQTAAIARSSLEVEFFKLIRYELKKSSNFFMLAEQEYKIRWDRICESYHMVREGGSIHDKNTWSRLLTACVKFYKDVLLLENFAIMNYCGFSKILKKHDKMTG